MHVGVINAVNFVYTPYPPYFTLSEQNNTISSPPDRTVLVGHNHVGFTDSLVLLQVTNEVFEHR